MVKRIPNLFLILMLLIVALACVVPGVTVTTPDPNFINTAIAQTQTAAPAIPITGLESPTPTMTRPPSATPFPTFTVVVIGVPQLSVSEDTICHTGPGTNYDRVGVLQAGEVAEVVGRSADGNFWVIRNPDRAGETCWISAQNAILTGSPGIVPVFALPPTPLPTNTRVPSFTSTPTRTPVPTSTPSRTPTPTHTPTSSFTPTPSFTPSSTPTSTPSTPTSSPTSTPTSSFTPTSTPTSSTPTTSPTVTSTPSTPTSSPTSTPTSSFTPTSTLSSSTPTTSPTVTSTLSPTPTFSPTPTVTPSFTPTSTPSPTFTPSPTATLSPGFAASFSGLESCTGTGWWVDLELENTGGLAFESIFVVLSDTVTGTVLLPRSDDFTNRDGCSTSNTQANLSPGATQIVSMPVFTYDPSGHELRATIILCSNAGQSGTCIAQAINFTP